MPAAKIFQVSITRRRDLTVVVPEGTTEDQLRKIIDSQADDLLDLYSYDAEVELDLSRVTEIADVDEITGSSSWRLNDAGDAVTDEETDWIEGMLGRAEEE